MTTISDLLKNFYASTSGFDEKLLPKLSLKLSDISVNFDRVTEAKVFFDIHSNIDEDSEKFEGVSASLIIAPSKDGKFSLLDVPLDGHDIPVLSVPDIRGFFSSSCYFLAEPLPSSLYGVTGTNGKSSVVDFTRQLLVLKKIKAASVGTLGIASDVLKEAPTLTTPGAESLALTLHKLKAAGVDHVALEASSHGLGQERLAGLKFAAVGFTSFSRDHLDYHADMKDYFAAKKRLFSELTKAGSKAIINSGLPADFVKELHTVATQQKLEVIEIGPKGKDVDIVSAVPKPWGQTVTVKIQGGPAEEFDVPLYGTFQAENLLMAALFTTDLKNLRETIKLFKQVRPVRGRLEHACETKNGARIFVDYAHTPDALEKTLTELRKTLPEGGKLHVVFGAGGNRDKGKRPLMGKACAEHADFCIVTDDNPRFEDPALIREEVLKGCPKAEDIADRYKAIEAAIKNLKKGDALLIAGKGHETWQNVHGVCVEFDDAQIARDISKAL